MIFMRVVFTVSIVGVTTCSDDDDVTETLSHWTPESRLDGSLVFSSRLSLPPPGRPGHQDQGVHGHSPQTMRLFVATPASSQNYEGSGKQRKQTIRYFLPRCNEPCVSVCECGIFK